MNFKNIKHCIWLLFTLKLWVTVMKWCPNRSLINSSFANYILWITFIKITNRAVLESTKSCCLLGLFESFNVFNLLKIVNSLSLNTSSRAWKIGTVSVAVYNVKFIQKFIMVAHCTFYYVISKISKSMNQDTHLRSFYIWQRLLRNVYRVELYCFDFYRPRTYKFNNTYTGNV